jgi:hypothetical protein
MVSLDAINAVERRYTEGGQPSLGEALALLRQRWDQGLRDRETGLRLLFLAWHGCCEPPFLTGLTGEGDYTKLLRDIFDDLGGEASEDGEFLFAAGYMASLFPWCFGPEAEWQQVGRRCLERWRRSGSPALAESVFEGRGAFGRYFARVARTKWSADGQTATADRPRE